MGRVGIVMAWYMSVHPGSCAKEYCSQLAGVKPSRKTLLPLPLPPLPAEGSVTAGVEISIATGEKFKYLDALGPRRRAISRSCPTMVGWLWCSTMVLYAGYLGSTAWTTLFCQEYQNASQDVWFNFPLIETAGSVIKAHMAATHT